MRFKFLHWIDVVKLLNRVEGMNADKNFRISAEWHDGVLYFYVEV